MKLTLFYFCLAAAIGATSGAVAADATKPLRALLVTGGGFHDYTAQKTILTEGLSARVNVEWTIVQEGTTREHRMSIYENPDWAKGFDVIVHNECFGMVADQDFVERVAAPHHAGVPAVILHASVHSYRNAPTDAWREVIGARSMSHEGRRDLKVNALSAPHPVMKGFPGEWENPNDELYKIEKTWPNAMPLAEVFGEETKQKHPVIWLNTVNGTRVFVTTLGHANETVESAVYLDLVARGLLWACGKLNDDGTPAKGYAAQRK